MTPPLVVGVDGSQAGLRAVDWAVDEAALRGVPLRVVYASRWEHYEGVSPTGDPRTPPDQALAENIVRAAARRARRRRTGVEIATDVLPEDPAYGLLRESAGATALVLGTRGRSGVVETLLGSVASEVVARSACPVVVVRGSHDNRVRPAEGVGPVVLGLGARGPDSAALRFALQEARLRGAPLDAVRAWRPPLRPAPGPAFSTAGPDHPAEREAADALAATVRDAPADVRLRPHAVEGRPRQVLLDASREAGLLVVGARRPPGHTGPWSGRIAHTVLHRSACPVAVVPERA
ncbi:universal stress protein [Streptomyces sp. NPDC096080]|uniref:universal stress protein n=1 Tax=Streptomyces sp. NPDC096080 TaxID=3156693 RepID=UPI003319022F